METKDQEAIFIKGFNQGYYLSKYEPGALSDIFNVENEWSVFIRGMKAGREEHFREAGKENVTAPGMSKETEFKKAFNMGYFFSKYEDGTGSKEAKLIFNKVNLPGFKEGARQFKNEQFENRLPSFMQGDKTITSSEPHRGKDDLEPEK